MDDSLTDIDIRIRELRTRLRHLDHVDAQRRALDRQRGEAESELAGLERELEEERRDVHRLEKPSLTSLLASVKGEKAERMDRERLEAARAEQKVRHQRGRLERLGLDAEAMDRELETRAAAESEYERVLAEKEERLRAGGHPAVPELDAVDNRVTDLEEDLREHDEAVEEGRRSLEAVRKAAGQVERARELAQADVFGGGVFTSAAKADEIEKASAESLRAQEVLDRFARELADVGLEVEFRLPLLNTDWFGDVLLDDFFTDIATHDEVDGARAVLDGLVKWIEQRLDDLDGAARRLRAEREESLRERADLLSR
ncbi:coiled-coil domain-containing protein [Salininema proteolyticum]|uniref:Uncharacterized protein n=1 Tax=Salininema proteolyticum TaxID=1607685 RepID=A0ABV8U3U1_9ACTN